MSRQENKFRDQLEDLGKRGEEDRDRDFQDLLGALEEPEAVRSRADRSRAARARVGGGRSRRGAQDGD